MGPFLTPFAEIEAFSKQMKIDIQPWEARVIRELGEAYLIHYKKQSERPHGMTKTISMSDSEGLKELFASAGQTKPTGKKGAPHGFGRTGTRG